MRRAIHLCALLAAALAARGQVVIDRVAASVGTSVITLSAVRRELRLDAFFRKVSYQESSVLRRQAVERLINQAILRREIEVTRYVAPPVAEADARLAEILRETSQTPDQFRANLAARGITEDELRQQLLWAATVFSFTEFRFGAGVQVSDQEVERYYREKYAPPGPGMASEIEQLREPITRILASQKTSQTLDEWLAQARTQLKVRIYEEALQ